MKNFIYKSLLCVLLSINSKTAYSQYDYQYIDKAHYSTLLKITGNPVPSYMLYGYGFAKMDEKGDVKFFKKFSSTPTMNPAPLIQTKNRRLVHALSIKNYALPLSDINMIRMDSTGYVFWSNAYTSSKDLIARYLIETSAGDLLICAATADQKAVLIKTNSSGIVLWSKLYSPNSGSNAYPAGIRELSNGNYEFLMRGYMCNNSLLVDAGSGNILSEMNLGAESCNNIFFTADKGYILLWYNTGLAQPAESRSFLTKRDSTGKMEWKFSYNGNSPGDDLFFSFREINGSYYFLGEASGYYSGTNFTGVHPYIVKVNKNGSVAWAKVFDNLATGYVGTIFGDIDLLNDTTFTLLYGNGDKTHVIKTDTNGVAHCPEYSSRPVSPIVAVEQDATGNESYTSQDLPLSFYTGIFGETPVYTVTRVCVSTSIPMIGQNELSIVCYPNPNTGEFIIQTNSSEKNLKYELVNTLGEKVVVSVLQSGMNTVDVSHLPAAMYCLRVFSEKHFSQKTILISR